jgi:hypothetical protein
MPELVIVIPWVTSTSGSDETDPAGGATEGPLLSREGAGPLEIAAGSTAAVEREIPSAIGVAATEPSGSGPVVSRTVTSGRGRTAVTPSSSAGGGPVG